MDERSTVRTIKRTNQEDECSSVSTIEEDEVLYPHMCSLFQELLLYFPYLPGRQIRTKNWFLRFLHLIAWPIQIWGLFKYTLLALMYARIISKNYYLSMALGDFSWYLKGPGFWWQIVLSLWFIVANSIRVIFLLSNTRPRLQYWLKPMLILENNKNVDDPPLAWIIAHSHTILRYSAVLCAVTGIADHFEMFLSFPLEFLPLTALNACTLATLGYVTGCWEVNFAMLVGFYLFYCARRFRSLGRGFRKNLSIKGIHRKSGQRYEHLIPKFIADIVELCQEIVKSEIFWYPVNNSTFMGMWVAETLLLYLMFFADIPPTLRAVIVFLGFLTIFFGQSVNFLPGAYCQHEYDLTIQRFLRLTSYDLSVPIRVKLKSLIALDYLIDRKLFYVFWSIDASLHNYLLVQTEVAMLLLLLIANTNR